MAAPHAKQPSDPLARVCNLLSRHRARYVIIGAQACILHGLVRTTEVVDILIEESHGNYQRVIDALSAMEDRAATELIPRDLANNIVVKVADKVEVDITRSAWNGKYPEAAAESLSTKIANIVVPYASLDTLMATKDTYRGQDNVGLTRLKERATQRTTFRINLDGVPDA